jgi:hypothetical protein
VDDNKFKEERKEKPKVKFAY